MSVRQVFVLTAVFSVSAALADDYINRADANGDGFVSLHELRAAYYADPDFNRRIEDSFARHDQDGDGLISAAERGVPEAMPETAVAGGEEQRPRAGRVSGDQYNLSVTPPSRISLEKPPAQTAAPRAPANVAAPVREAEATPAASSSNSRTARWIREIDADNSGGASAAELLASGDGQQWFTDREFDAADRNDDGDLDEEELAALIASLERRQRR